MDEVSGLTHATDRDYLAVVDDNGEMREYDRNFLPVQAGPVSLPTGSGDGEVDDAEGIVYIGDYFTDWDYCILDEGDTTNPVRLHLFPFAPGQTTLSSSDITTYELPKIPRYSGQTYGGEGAEGIAFDHNTGLFYVSNQSDTQDDVGIWEVDIENMDTDGDPTHTLLYTYVSAGIVNGVGGVPSPVALSDLEDGTCLPYDESRPRSLFLLTRDATGNRRMVLQLDRSSGAVISSFQHGHVGQVEGLCFDSFAARGDMFIAGEEASCGVPNLWRYSFQGGAATTSLTTSATTSVTTTASTSATSTRSTSATTSASSTATTSATSTCSTTASSSASTSSNSTSFSTSVSSTASTESTTIYAAVLSAAFSDLDTTDDVRYDLEELDGNTQNQHTYWFGDASQIEVIGYSLAGLPNKTQWDSGHWKVRVRFFSFGSGDSVGVSVYVGRVDAGGALQEGWKAMTPASLEADTGVTYIFRGTHSWDEGSRTDRIAIRYVIENLQTDDMSFTMLLGVWGHWGVDKPINTNTSSLSTSATSSVSSSATTAVY